MRTLLRTFLFLAVWAAILPATPPASASPDAVRVDWLLGQATARAVEPVDPDPYAPTGDPAVALRKAALAARKELLAAVSAVRFDADCSVSELLGRDQALASRVRGFLQNSPFQGAETTTPDGGRGMEATAAAVLSGPLLDVLMPPSLVQFQSGVPPRRALGPQKPFTPPAPSLAPLSEGAAPAPLLAQPPAALSGPSGHSGLIVDARDLSLVPALLPVLFDESGTGIYGAFLVSRTSALAHRLALYAASPTDPALRERCGARPLTVRATGLAGASGTDPVLSARDAEQARAVLRGVEVLARCAVAILWTPPAVPAETAAAGNETPR